MNRIEQVDPARATGKTKQLFDAVQSKLGATPNMFRALGNSPAALEAFVKFNGALAGGFLNARVREQIALTVAEANLCEYCLSAHTVIGAKAGLSEREIEMARHATAISDKTDAILKLARNIVLGRGQVSDAEMAEARSAGVNDAEIVEVVVNVAESILTNYLNIVARTVNDFPAVNAHEPAGLAGAASGHH